MYTVSLWLHYLLYKVLNFCYQVLQLQSKCQIQSTANFCNFIETQPWPIHLRIICDCATRIEKLTIETVWPAKAKIICYGFLTLKVYKLLVYMLWPALISDLVSSHSSSYSTLVSFHFTLPENIPNTFSLQCLCNCFLLCFKCSSS